MKSTNTADTEGEQLFLDYLAQFGVPVRRWPKKEGKQPDWLVTTPAQEIVVENKDIEWGHADNEILELVERHKGAFADVGAVPLGKTHEKLLEALKKLSAVPDSMAYVPVIFSNALVPFTNDVIITQALYGPTQLSTLVNPEGAQLATRHEPRESMTEESDERVGYFGRMGLAKRISAVAVLWNESDRHSMFVDFVLNYKCSGGERPDLTREAEHLWLEEEFAKGYRSLPRLCIYHNPFATVSLSPQAFAFDKNCKQVWYDHTRKTFVIYESESSGNGMSISNEFLSLVQHRPDYILFGEMHEAGSAFRTFVFEHLPELLGRGYRRLAIEFMPSMEGPINEYFRDEKSTLDVLNELKQLSPKGMRSIDQSFMDSLKSWVNSGGELIYFNSDDPSPEQKDLTNESGRDEQMFRSIERQNPCVILVGAWHTLVRPKNERTDIYSGKELLEAKFVFQSLAEKISDAGKSLFSVGVVAPGQNCHNGNFESFGFQSTVSFKYRSFSLDSFRTGTVSGKNNFVAPELPVQTVSPRIAHWDGIFIERNRA